jgi:hypothetical protein
LIKYEESNKELINKINKLNIITSNISNATTQLSTCKEILESGLSTGNGFYEISINMLKYKVYCDMENGGWTKIEYKEKLEYKQWFTGGDGWKWMPNEFSTVLPKEVITVIRSRSKEGKQKYIHRCNGVMGYYYQHGNNYNNALQFKMSNNLTDNYPYKNIKILKDNCKSNGGENGLLEKSTDFEIKSKEVPVLNIKTQDNGDNGEKFGSPLESAWLR